MNHKYHVVRADGCSYVICAASAAAALAQADGRMPACEVEDHFGLTMPEGAQWDGTGADWLRAECRKRGVVTV